MSFYKTWGFTDNPFQTTALPATKLGETLLVGRHEEVERLQRRLVNPPKFPTVEGLNGVGKTSLVNVATYKCFQEHLEDRSKPLLIPCRRPFQLTSEESNLQEFKESVFREVAQTLIDASVELPSLIEKSPDSVQLNAWLNSPERIGYQGGLWIISGGKSTETNTGEGFEKSGFEKRVMLWLKAIFPDQTKGGVVCVIDNLELLQTSDIARRHLEALRDDLLSVPGLRWVLCGALGIVLGVASSPRLEGRLHGPIELTGVRDDVTGEIYESRVQAYGTGNVYLPIVPHDFLALYEVLDRNLRSLLHYTDEFCQWAADRQLAYAHDEKRAKFLEWLCEVSIKALHAADGIVTPKAWEVFTKAATDLHGSFSPSDYQSFGFNTPQALRTHVLALEAAHLVVSTRDDGDKRRKTIQVTPKGWLAKFARDISGNMDKSDQADPASDE